MFFNRRKKQEEEKRKRLRNLAVAGALGLGALGTAAAAWHYRDAIKNSIDFLLNNNNKLNQSSSSPQAQSPPSAPPPPPPPSSTASPPPPTQPPPSLQSQSVSSSTTSPQSQTSSTAQTTQQVQVAKIEPTISQIHPFTSKAIPLDPTLESNVELKQPQYPVRQPYVEAGSRQIKASPEVGTALSIEDYKQRNREILKARRQALSENPFISNREVSLENYQNVINAQTAKLDQKRAERRFIQERIQEAQLGDGDKLRELREQDYKQIEAVKGKMEASKRGITEGVQRKRQALQKKQEALRAIQDFYDAVGSDQLETLGLPSEVNESNLSTVYNLLKDRKDVSEKGLLGRTWKAFVEGRESRRFDPTVAKNLNPELTSIVDVLQDYDPQELERQLSLGESLIRENQLNLRRAGSELKAARSIAQQRDALREVGSYITDQIKDSGNYTTNFLMALKDLDPSNPNLSPEQQERARKFAESFQRLSGGKSLKDATVADIEDVYRRYQDFMGVKTPFDRVDKTENVTARPQRFGGSAKNLERVEAALSLVGLSKDQAADEKQLKQLLVDKFNEIRGKNPNDITPNEIQFLEMAVGNSLINVGSGASPLELKSLPMPLRRQVAKAIKLRAEATRDPRIAGLVSLVKNSNPNNAREAEKLVADINDVLVSGGPNFVKQDASGSIVDSLTDVESAVASISDAVKHKRRDILPTDTIVAVGQSSDPIADEVRSRLAAMNVNWDQLSSQQRQQIARSIYKDTILDAIPEMHEAARGLNVEALKNKSQSGGDHFIDVMEDYLRQTREARKAAVRTAALHRSLGNDPRVAAKLAQSGEPFDPGLIGYYADSKQIGSETFRDAVGRALRKDKDAQTAQTESVSPSGDVIDVPAVPVESNQASSSILQSNMQAVANEISSNVKNKIDEVKGALVASKAGTQAIAISDKLNQVKEAIDETVKTGSQEAYNRAIQTLDELEGNMPSMLSGLAKPIQELKNMIYRMGSQKVPDVRAIRYPSLTGTRSLNVYRTDVETPTLSALQQLNPDLTNLDDVLSGEKMRSSLSVIRGRYPNNKASVGAYFSALDNSNVYNNLYVAEFSSLNKLREKNKGKDADSINTVVNNKQVSLLGYSFRKGRFGNYKFA